MTLTTTIAVSEIHCESCERAISAALIQMDGVIRVSPSASSNLVKVTYDEMTVSDEELRAKLVAVGYDPVI